MSHRRQHVFIGIDTHKDQHTAAICDCWHEALATTQLASHPGAFPGFLDWVKQHCPDGLQPVFGIEGSGSLGRPLAAFLVEAGYVVKEVNPVFTDRQRERRPHPEKSDVLDARAIAKVLIDEFPHLPDARPDELLVALAQADHHRDTLVKARTQVHNRLHAQLHEQYPRYREMFDDPFCQSALAFWDRFPHPKELQRVGVARLGAFFRAHTRNRVSNAKAEHVLQLVDRTAPYTIAPQQRAQIIRHLVAQLRLLDAQIAEVERQLAELYGQTGHQLHTMPGVGTVLAAKFVAKIRYIERFANADKLARYIGAAPMERSSGKRRKRSQSLRGRRELNWALYMTALTHIALGRNGEPRCPESRAYYERKIAEGKSHAAAIRCLMRRLCNVIFAMMRDRSAYETPAQRRARHSLTAAA